MKLLLDDERDSLKVFGFTNAAIYKEDWIIVRNYEEFVAYYKRANTLVTHISFDHDLGEDVAKELVSKGLSKRKARAQKKLCKSGYDCAKWLIEYILERKISLPIILIHTQNPVGRDNIKFLFDNYERTIRMD